MTFDLPKAPQGGRQAYMPGTTYQFDLPRAHRSIIKVIGVGGGGSNAVNHMFRMGIKDVEFIVCNTDAQALQTSPVPNRLQIGTALTEGLGCGANPEVGRAAAIESQDQIKEVLKSLEDKYKINKRTLKKAAGLYHKQTALEFENETAEVREVYKAISEVYKSRIS